MSHLEPRLGVNIDHIATLRQARMTVEPDPVAAAVLCELAGADGLTVHLREDRDLELLRRTVRTTLNLEMAATEEMVAIALANRPDQVTLVPEKRQEVTTEGGLDVAGQSALLAPMVERLRSAGIVVATFIDPELAQIEASRAIGAQAIELHTGTYANAWPHADAELHRLQGASAQALDRGLWLHAGHGLTYWNVRPIAEIPGMRELNIGHSLIARAVLVGLERAVREMKQAMRGAI